MGGLQLGALLEIPFHELFIDFDHLIDNFGMGLTNRKKVGFPLFHIEEAIDDRLSLAGRKIQRQTFLPEGFADRAKQCFKIDVRCINFVHDDQSTIAARGSGFHRPVGDHFDAGLGIDHDCGGFHPGQDT